jgi:hypothetical protein
MIFLNGNFYLKDFFLENENFYSLTRKLLIFLKHTFLFKKVRKQKKKINFYKKKKKKEF